MFSPVNPFTINYIGQYFMAGNTGFMRQQVQYLQQTGEYELGAAIGMAGNNPGVSDGDLETTKSPSYVLRLSRKLTAGRVGLSGIYSQLQYLDISSHRREAMGANAFYEYLGTGFQIKGEVYYGQNLANMGLLCIGKGSAQKDITEYGGHVTMNFPLNEHHIVFGGVGTALVANRSDVTAFSTKATGQIENQGILQNITTKVGYEYKVDQDLSLLAEVTRFQNQTKLPDSNQLNIVPVIETGLQLNF